MHSLTTFSFCSPHMTVEQNISYVPNLLNKQNRKKTKEAVGKWIARALAASPNLLLMDNPETDYVRKLVSQ